MNFFDKAGFNKYEYNGKIEYLSRERSHEIIFFKNTKLIESRCGIGSEYITMQELQAINEKVKELRLEIETSLKSDKKERENKMDKKYPPIVGKCKERLDNGTCLGCNRLELYEFTGDDNCPLFRDEQIEINEKGEIK